MKKLVYLLLFMSSISYAQNAFMEYQFFAKRGTESAILALTDSQVTSPEKRGNHCRWRNNTLVDNFH